ncbi:unnamed protein product [Meloidogyne enterolobii]|uniref:Uncharacterized protein n=1 Tax=Meloidogyne enterolobii TaxID=390850 RepID=A0ACB1AUE0_MELEN
MPDSERGINELFLPSSFFTLKIQPSCVLAFKIPPVLSFILSLIFFVSDPLFALKLVQAFPINIYIFAVSRQPPTLACMSTTRMTSVR